MHWGSTTPPQQLPKPMCSSVHSFFKHKLSQNRQSPYLIGRSGDQPLPHVHTQRNPGKTGNGSLGDKTRVSLLPTPHLAPDTSDAHRTHEASDTKAERQDCLKLVRTHVNL